MSENLTEEMIVNDDGTISIPNHVYEVLAEAAKLKYNFRGKSKATIKKYVTKYIEDTINEHFAQETVVAVPNEFLPKGKRND